VAWKASSAACRSFSSPRQTRKTIGQAIGILMERYRIDADRAFQFLIRASSTSNVKLRDVADEVVASSIERYRSNT
jgi:AmiR/NasT family two-component response regulator